MKCWRMGVKVMDKKCNMVLNFIVYLIIFEVVLGGAGRVFAIGPLSIRMLLYVIAFLAIVFCIFSNGLKSYKINIKDMKIFYIIIGLFLIWVGFSAVNGYLIQHHSLHEVIGDVTGYASFLLIIAFNLAANGKEQIKKVTIAFVIASVIQATVILIIHYGLGMKIFQFDNMNSFLQTMYIGNLSYIVPNSIRIFFKSSIYLQIAFIILVGMSSKSEFSRYKNIIYLSIVFVAYAIIITFTRGFWIGVVISLIVYIILKQVQNLIKVCIVILLGLAIMLGISYVSFGNNNMLLSIVTRTGLIHQASISNNANRVTVQPGIGGDDLSLDYRKKLSREMTNTIKMNPILGNGFGVLLAKLNQTSSRCEYMYLDILMEMGAVGLLLFLAIFVLIFIKWIKIKINMPNSKDIYLLDAIMVSLIGLLITTGLNPFFNNPLGITFTVFAICAVNVYGKDQ